ncbi:MAG: ATP-binding protein [Lachnospiraceae bacterium]|nr:ATP-binding protein [Lachnospiraceae bacterium]
MQITALHIRNFKFIRDLNIRDIEQALILVGQNNTGKTSILDAIRVVMGTCPITDLDFNEKKQNIEIFMTLAVSDEDLRLFHAYGIISQYKRYDAWLRDFKSKLPSFQEHQLSFTFTANWNREIRYSDGIRKNNRYIPKLLPKIYFIDTGRNLQTFQEDLLLFQDEQQLIRLRSNACMFNPAKQCNQCFSCIGLINQKNPEQLLLTETARLLEYKMYQLNLRGFAEKVNENYRKNGGYEEIQFTLTCNPDALFHVTAEARHEQQQLTKPVERLGNGMKSIYMLSLLETYIEDENRIPSIIIVEYPELFLHPSLQKTACDILYRLSKKNQVIFTTHAPAMISNFTRRQLRQVVLDAQDYSVVRENADIDAILDDLGYGAADFMNASFVFIVEGRQDKSRLPLLLEKYYSDVTCDDGSPARISIITTNSCTNIKTYANLKYMNQVYLKDQFLMIRDGDGKDPELLASQLCQYYEERGQEDVDRLPRVRRRNVLILKYYSFENYFLNPDIMAQLGIVESADQFYEILFTKWKEYLHRIKSGQQLINALGHDLLSVDDLKAHMEEFKIHMRGHNLYDIFYGRYRQNETELLKRYLELAPRDDFKDILDAIDAFAYFDSRKI